MVEGDFRSISCTSAPGICSATRSAGRPLSQAGISTPMAAMCAGVEPQQAPTRSMPSCVQRGGVRGHARRRGVVLEVVADHVRQAGVRLRDEQQAPGCGPRPSRPRWPPSLRGRGRSSRRPRRRRPPPAGHGAPGRTPIIVRRLVSKLIVAMTGRSGATVRAAATAASTSARSLMVSISTRSIPPATSAASCSAKYRLAPRRRHGAQRRQQLAGRTEVAGHEQPVRVGDRAGDAGRGPLTSARGPRARASPAAAGCRRRCWSSGSRARLGVRLVGRADRVRALDVPQLAGAAVLEAGSCSSVPIAPSSSTGGPRPAAPRVGSSAQPVEVAGSGRPATPPRAGRDPVQPSAGAPSPAVHALRSHRRGSRRCRCRRAASRPRRSPPGTAWRAAPSRSSPPAPRPSRGARAIGSPGTPSRAGEPEGPSRCLGGIVSTDARHRSPVRRG